MDYKTVRAKLASGAYDSSAKKGGDGGTEPADAKLDVDPSLFAADMRRIYVNAITYNWDGANQCHVDARAAIGIFEELFEAPRYSRDLAEMQTRCTS